MRLWGLGMYSLLLGALVILLACCAGHLLDTIVLHTTLLMGLWSLVLSIGSGFRYAFQGASSTLLVPPVWHQVQVLLRCIPMCGEDGGMCEGPCGKEECCICLGTCTERGLVCGTAACGHHFHGRCLVRWCMHSDLSALACPLCRSPPTCPWLWEALCSATRLHQMCMDVKDRIRQCHAIFILHVSVHANAGGAYSLCWDDLKACTHSMHSYQRLWSQVIRVCREFFVSVRAQRRTLTRIGGPPLWRMVLQDLTDSSAVAALRMVLVHRELWISVGSENQARCRDLCTDILLAVEDARS